MSPLDTAVTTVSVETPHELNQAQPDIKRKKRSTAHMLLTSHCSRYQQNHCLYGWLTVRE